MECGAANFEALAETTVFLSYFKQLPDRRQLGKVVYPLEEILLLCLLAVLAGAESFVDIARKLWQSRAPITRHRSSATRRLAAMMPMQRGGCWRWPWCLKDISGAKPASSVAWTVRPCATGFYATTPKVSPGSATA